jgi:hypothetical protein
MGSCTDGWRRTLFTRTSFESAVRAISMSRDAQSAILQLEAGAVDLFGSTLLSLWWRCSGCSGGDCGAVNRFVRPRQLEPEELAILHPRRTESFSTNGRHAGPAGSFEGRARVRWRRCVSVDVVA